VEGKVICGRYRLVEQLGRGGMSEVWLAEDEQLERPVALKLIAPHADRRRFEREARAAAALSHANVERIYEVGEDEGRPYMALEYLPGGTLEERLVEGRPIPDEEVASIAADLAAGLAHAHAQGLVHRDLKPANVLFDAEGRAKIADFGIARLAGADTFTEDGTVMGTAGYISPEQASGEPATPASDVYSFGVILFRVLTGRLPFEGESALEVAAMHRDVEPPAIDLLRPNAPPLLATIATAALAKDPRLRPPDGAALFTALGRDAPAMDETVVLPRPPTPRRSRGKWLVAVAGVAVLLAGGLTAAAVLTHDSGAGGTGTEQRTNTHSRRSNSQTTAPAPAPSTTASTTRSTTTHTTPTAPPPPPPPTTAPTTTTTPTTTASPPTTTTLPAPPGG
jgi:eukaryotic-like serine/threonine-protein kinase